MQKCSFLLEITVRSRGFGVAFPMEFSFGGCVVYFFLGCLGVSAVIRGVFGTGAGFRVGGALGNHCMEF